jgi:hypothetical protein
MRITNAEYMYLINKISEDYLQSLESKFLDEEDHVEYLDKLSHIIKIMRGIKTHADI